MTCLFCEVQINDRIRIVAENEFGYVIRDGFPVTPLHTLIIPKRHVFDYFRLNTSEVVGLNHLLLAEKDSLLIEDSNIDGFNIGMNCGETAGQTIFHCHVHLIPRRKGDVENPRGGVRHVIPSKGFYKS
jgi:diadenosine tetraphosphate (Ap4A) HIT family hydrolase